MDLSYNKIEDVSSDSAFNLPKSVTEVILSNNILHDLPWKKFKNVTKLNLLDIRDNFFESFGPELMEMVLKDTDIYFEGKLTIRGKGSTAQTIKYFL